MPTNYLTTDTDLTSVANAIRTKGGTSAQLAFPADFVSAINAISGGGGGTSGTIESDYVTLEWAVVTVGANSVANASQVEPYLLGLAGFSTSGYYYAWFSVIDPESWHTNMAICTNINGNLYNAKQFYRYRSGSISSVPVGASYDAKIRAGDKYLISCLRWKGAPTV